MKVKIKSVNQSDAAYVTVVFEVYDDLDVLLFTDTKGVASYKETLAEAKAEIKQQLKNHIVERIKRDKAKARDAANSAVDQMIDVGTVEKTP